MESSAGQKRSDRKGKQRLDVRPLLQIELNLVWSWGWLVNLQLLRHHNRTIDCHFHGAGWFLLMSFLPLSLSATQLKLNPLYKLPLLFRLLSFCCIVPPLPLPFRCPFLSSLFFLTARRSASQWTTRQLVSLLRHLCRVAVKCTLWCALLLGGDGIGACR